MAIDSGVKHACVSSVDGVAAGLGKGPYAVSLSQDVMVAMRDGVQLAVDLYVPVAAEGSVAPRWPCLLERTPYDKSGTAQSDVVAGQPLPLSKP